MPVEIFSRQPNFRKAARCKDSGNLLPNSWEFGVRWEKNQLPFSYLGVEKCSRGGETSSGGKEEMQCTP